MLNRNNVVLIAAIGIFLACLAVFALWNTHEDSTEESDLPEEEKVEVVSFNSDQMENSGVQNQTAQPGNLYLSLQLPGKVILNPQRYAHIVSPSGGIVKEAHKVVGDPVIAGEVLAILESREMAQAKATYLAALRKEALAAKVLEREQFLQSKMIAPELDFLQAETTAEETKIDLELAKQQLYALGLSDSAVQKIPTNNPATFRSFELRAPFDGTVINRHLTIGEVIDSAQEAYVIANLDHLWVELSAYPKDLPFLKPGQQVTIEDNMGNHTEGVLTRLGPTMDTENSRITALVEIDNSEKTWRPGQYVRASIHSAELTADVIVPCQSIMKIDNQECIFVLVDQDSEEGEAVYEKRDIRSGPTDGKNVAILEGLNPGENFAAENAFILKFEMTKGEPD